MGSDKGVTPWVIDATAAKVRHYCDRGATLLRQRCEIDRPLYSTDERFDRIFRPLEGEADAGSGPLPDPEHPGVLGQRLRLPRPRQLLDVAEGPLHRARSRRMEEAEEGGRKRRLYVGYDFHELRRTQATFLIGNGIDPKSVQGRLGHEVSSMTMDVCAHDGRERPRSRRSPGDPARGGRAHHHRRGPDHRHGEGGLGQTSPRRSTLPP